MADKNYENSSHAEFFDNGDGSSPREKAPPKFQHTMAELEDEVNATVIKECKIDACFERFFYRLVNISPDYQPRDFPNLKSSDGPALEEITLELQGNLNRLVPEYLDGKTLDLKNEKILKRLMGRWDTIEANLKSPNLDCVPKGLLDMLIEKQLRQRSGTRQDVLPVASTEAQTTSIESCRQLKGLVDGQQATASFACGGAIPIAATDIPQPEGSQVSDPVNIFWVKDNNDTNARRVVLPLAEGSSPEVLNSLVRTCSPATFGRGQQDVMDESYRKAGKLEPDQFATSFHPADFGIIETVEKILLPTMSSKEDLPFHKIHAELYKLNIYSGPSGLFRSHVDTPRSTQQVGSLVICLPSPFQGGSLMVRHHGQEVEFDWSANTSSIQWAAFYSDCEHEIKTITEGDRITLTYNLYITEREKGVIPSIVDPKMLPLYGWMKNHLTKPGFMDEGGVLGMFCAHAYPTTSDFARFQFPQALKGADLALYSVFESLGLEVEILPVLEYEGQYFAENPELGLSGTIGDKYSYFDCGDYYEFNNLEKYLKEGKELSMEYREIMPETQTSDDYADVDRRWKLLMLTRRVKGMRQAVEYAKRKNIPQKPGPSFYETEGARIGSCIRPYTTSSREYGECGDLEDAIEEQWPTYYLPGITWITEPKHDEMAFSHLVYGNNSEMFNHYSCAAIFAAIPPLGQRGTLGSAK